MRNIYSPTCLEINPRHGILLHHIIYSSIQYIPYPMSNWHISGLTPCQWHVPSFISFIYSHFLCLQNSFVDSLISINFSTLVSYMDLQNLFGRQKTSLTFIASRSLWSSSRYLRIQVRTLAVVSSASNRTPITFSNLVIAQHLSFFILVVQQVA